MESPILSVKNVSKVFVENVILKDVNFTLERGSFKTILGPNGAGKTTLFNIISGVMPPTSGNVVFNGKDITSMPAYERAQLGLGRSFQITNIFPRSTVHENLRIVAQAKSGNKYNMFKNFSSYKQTMEFVDSILETVKLHDKRDICANELSHAEQRKLEIGMQLALGSELILFDEPTAGVSLEEVPPLIDAIMDIKASGKVSILLIEHKMGMVMDCSDTIAILHGGVLIADDTPEAISANPEVQAAYLGGGAAHG